MEQTLYPLKFTPILKEKIWGGTKLKTLLNRESDLPNIGESWEISGVKDDTSIVSNGAFKGTSLNSLQDLLKEDLVGAKNYKDFGEKFPLLIKFIDAKTDLSIQLHPNDALATKRHNSFGKTEMWYVLQANKGSNLIVGFNQQVDKAVYQKHVEEKTLTQILNTENVEEGDAYFIGVGRIHAIGAGVMVAEIQQTSDITYRIYDWDRVDDQGNKRELHTQWALGAIDFSMKNDFKLSYSKTKNETHKIVSCSYFTTNYIHLEAETINKINTFDSFIVYMCVDGEATITYNQETTQIIKGETVLLPAALLEYEITSKKGKLLEVYV
ncbi:mannose-6-phosphate isomerase [Bizionia gelidisalsuginis]|uniref:Phosphohexomutase n=2 Tax=Bizionia TaxID=283785 RepID=A0A8H2LC91_9FLAO|nr:MULTISPECIES: type I phosphomannose isomerase catalytic subunit [Bizionia]TYB70476.1 mannose-6-phosphate isomerase [Bizionia saleffrena]TYC10621.1 mannose-6-phosphate isomerase [Bizionia gelidisalsuginis]